MKKGLIQLVLLIMVGFLFAAGNSTDIDQTNNFNQANVTQTGNDNVADVDQISTATSSSESNIAEITQASNNNDFIIDQTGKSNVAIMSNEIRDGAVSKVYQNGVDNRAEAELISSGVLAGKSFTSFQEQIGNHNVTSRIKMDGINSSTYNFQFGDYNHSHTSIAGDNNWTLVTQGVNSAAANHNYVYSETDGDNNDVIVDQVGDYNNTIIVQEYQSNTSIVDLDQTNGSNATIKQNSLNMDKNYQNVVKLNQTNSSFATINQGGSNGGGYNIVKGLGTAEFGQSLNGSILDIDQIGNHNVVSLYQDDGIATVSQTGNSNDVIIHQY